MNPRYNFTQAKPGPIALIEGKTRVTLYLDNTVLAAFRSQATLQGKGYQTLINEALSQLIQAEALPLTVDDLRQVLREELHAA